MGGRLTDGGLNARAWELADAMAARAAQLGVGVTTLPTGSRVIDVGVAVPGGVEAGLWLARICMGGLGHVEETKVAIGADQSVGVRVATDSPAVCCMASQYAGWAIQVGKYFAMGSGPLRAHARVERELFSRLCYGERADRGVLVLETRTPPSAAVAAWVGQKAGLDPSRLTFLVAPTASIAGSVQIAARVVETGLHKMDVLGFDVRRVVSGAGTAPVAPVAASDLAAIGRTNDCVLYGGEASYVVGASDAELAELASRLPATASRDYGTPFSEIFQRSGGDFYKIDPLLFSPATVSLTSAQSGNTHRGGRTNPDVLRRSFSEL